MPQIDPTQTTTEESQKQLDAQESLHSSAMDKIKGGDVFKSLAADLPGAEAPAEEVQEETQEQEQTEEETTQEETQETDEEVIPKSKIQPRIDHLTARAKAAEAEVERLKAKEPVDDTQRQLDEMSEGELEDTLAQVRLQKEKVRDNDQELLKAIKLERQIEKSIATAPQKFSAKQVQEANNTIQRLASEGELSNANYSKVVEIAKGIYERYPKMQKSVDGQSMAIELAVEHYKALGKVSSVNATTQNLKAQNNTLKKKTMLDTKQIKSGGEKITLDKLRSAAMTGSMRDKEKFAHSDPRFKIDAMIPDHLKG